MFLATAGANGPNLARFQRIAANTVFTVQLGSGNKFFHPVLPHDIAEMGIAEFSRPDPLLLFLDPPTAFQGNANGPFQVFIGNFLLAIGIQQLEQAADCLVDGIGVPAGKGAAEKDPVLQHTDAALVAQPAPASGSLPNHLPLYDLSHQG